MSERALKIATTVFLVVGICMMLAWPIVLKRPGPNLSTGEKQMFAVRYLAYVFGLLVDFILTSIGAYLVLRRTRERYAVEAEQNLRRMIEGTIEDHRKSQH